jgi:hypothetical protein
MATLEAEYTEVEHRYQDLDEAVAGFRERLNCPGGAEPVLRSTLGSLLPRSADGEYRLDRSGWNASIHWDVRHQPVTDAQGARP